MLQTPLPGGFLLFDDVDLRCHGLVVFLSLFLCHSGQLGGRKEHPLAVGLLLGELHLHDELLPGLGRAEQVKGSVFVGNHQTMVLLVEPLEGADLLSGDEDFNEPDEEWFVSAPPL